jgi:hypothetical protein
MALQRIFTPEYANQLTNDINPENYLGEKILYNENEVRQLKGVEKPEGLEEKMLEADNEYEAAILLYDAYKEISPIIASNRCFWIYLTHVDLSRYVRKVWPDLEKISSDSDRKKYIRDHWLISPNGLMRTTLMNLWWSVYLTIDESLGDDHKYDLTKIFFSNTGMRTRRLGTGHLGRNREALKGILTFIKENPDIFESGIENRMIWITRHFNLIGGTKPLANMPSSFFKGELDKFKGHLQSISCREDVIGPEAFI